jgi:hypothetical protein
VQDVWKMTPLMRVASENYAKKRHLKVAKLLLRAGADPNRKGSGGTVANCAKEHRNTHIRKLLKEVTRRCADAPTREGTRLTQAGP